MSRRTKTPRERAEEALGVEERRVERLEARRDALRAETEEVELEVAIATRRRDFLRQHPDLDPATTELPLEGAS